MSSRVTNSEALAHSDVWAVIVDHYENCLAQHGATPQSVDWPNGPDLVWGRPQRVEPPTEVSWRSR